MDFQHVKYLPTFLSLCFRPKLPDNSYPNECLNCNNESCSCQELNCVYDTLCQRANGRPPIEDLQRHASIRTW